MSNGRSPARSRLTATVFPRSWSKQLDLLVAAAGWKSSCILEVDLCKDVGRAVGCSAHGLPIPSYLQTRMPLPASVPLGLEYPISPSLPGHLNPAGSTLRFFPLQLPTHEMCNGLVRCMLAVGIRIVATLSNLWRFIMGLIVHTSCL